MLTEPALTNVGLVHPEPGIPDALLELTRRQGVLLAIEEDANDLPRARGFTAAGEREQDIVTGIVLEHPRAGDHPVRDPVDHRSRPCARP
ncbi:MAG TPA: hypothetical protein VK926_06145, partial [Gaiellaceae bacterium]|nr:hypothetical protein [Gaiellaceae bacterium]